MQPYGYNPQLPQYAALPQYQAPLQAQYPPSSLPHSQPQEQQGQKPVRTPKNLGYPPGEKPQCFDHINLVIEPTGRRGGLYIGDILSSVIPEILGPDNIRAILSVGHDAAFVPEECPYKKIEANKAILCIDQPGYDMTQHFEQAIAFIEEQLNCGRNLLVHCHAGVSRSATVMIAYLMTKNQWSYEESLTFLKSKRKWVKPNPGFVEQLKAYERRLENMRRSRISSVNEQMRSSSSLPILPIATNGGSVVPLPPQELVPGQMHQQFTPTPVPNGVPAGSVALVPANTMSRVPNIQSSTFPLSRQLSSRQLDPMQTTIQPPQNNPPAPFLGYQNAFVWRPRIQKSQANSIKHSLIQDVGSLCSFADNDQLEFGYRPQHSDYTQFSNARRSHQKLPNGIL